MLFACDIQHYLEYIIKKHETLTDKLPVQIHLNRIQNSVKFKIKFGYYIEVLTPETMKLLGSTTKKAIKDKNVDNMPRLDITQVVLVHWKSSMAQGFCLHLF